MKTNIKGKKSKIHQKGRQTKRKIFKQENKEMKKGNKQKKSKKERKKIR